MVSHSPASSNNGISATLLGEEVPSPSSPSWTTSGHGRKRSILLTLMTLCVGALIADVAFNLASIQHGLSSYKLVQSNPSEEIKLQDDSPLVLGSPHILAMVSFSKQSRTRLLDCYLQQNLVRNGGLLDRIIFVPDTEDREELEWLTRTVSQVDGYHLLGDGGPEDDQLHDGMAEKLVPFSQAKPISSSLGKSWMVAHALSKAMEVSGDTREPLWLFIEAETIYLSPEMVASLVETHQANPEYALVHANMVNQQTLSWVHNKLGAAKPYRPEVSTGTEQSSVEAEPKASSSESASEVDDGDANAGRYKSSSSWRASELPLWSVKHSKALEPTQRSEPSPRLFGVPVDFDPPPDKHRWLPFDPRAYPDPSAGKNDPVNFYQRPPMFSRIKEGAFDLSGPGIWPWTVFAQQLYSFLEHLEEEHNVQLCSHGDAAETERLGRTQGLARYHFPMWACDNEAMSLSLFLVFAADIDATLHTPNEFPYEANNSEIEEWLLKGDANPEDLQSRLAVVDGHAVAARFAPDIAVRSADWDLGDHLEKTDLLDRFHAYGEEVGCHAGPRFRKR